MTRRRCRSGPARGTARTPPSEPEQQRVLEHGGDHRREQRLGDGVERPAARGAGEDEAGAELERGRGEDQERRGQRDGELAEDALEGRAGIEPELLGGLEP